MSASDWSYVLGDAPGVEFVRLLWCDAAGIRRCRVIPRQQLEQAGKHGVGLAYACLWLPAWGDCCLDDPACVPVGEMRLVPDTSAVHVLPWMPSHATALVTMCREPPAGPWECCPRSALKRVLAQALGEHGLSVRLGFELEFHLLHKPAPGVGGGDSSSGGAVPHPIDSSNYCSSGALDAAAPVLQEMCAVLSSLGIPVEQLHAESGPGQFELATGHAPALQAADALLHSQEAVSAVALRHGMVASFLPKIWEGSAGSGLHCHWSVWRGAANLLRHTPAAAAAAAAVGAEGRRSAAAPVAAGAGTGGGAGTGSGTGSAMGSGTSAGSSSTGGSSCEVAPAVPGLAPQGEAFLAGVLRHLPALLCFTTPSPNSFRRLRPQCWAGAYQCYGVNNREAPLRLCSTPGQPDAANCELKAFDATANPHLAAAAMIVAGLLGVQQHLRLPPPVALDPGTLSKEQRQAAGIQRLPGSLGEALDAFQADTELRQALAAAFGTDTLVRAFLAVRRSEWEHFQDMPLEQEAALLYAQY